MKFHSIFYAFFQRLFKEGLLFVCLSVVGWESANAATLDQPQRTVYQIQNRSHSGLQVPPDRAALAAEATYRIMNDPDIAARVNQVLHPHALPQEPPQRVVSPLIPISPLSPAPTAEQEREGKVAAEESVIAGAVVATAVVASMSVDAGGCCCLGSHRHASPSPSSCGGSCLPSCSGIRGLSCGKWGCCLPSFSCGSPSLCCTPSLSSTALTPVLPVAVGETGPSEPTAPSSVLLNISFRESQYISSLSSFFLGGVQKHLSPFSIREEEQGTFNTIVFSKNKRLIASLDWGLMQRGVGNIMLVFPLEDWHQTSPLLYLKQLGTLENNTQEGSKIVSSYTLQLRGTIKSSHFKKIREVLQEWSAGGYAQLTGLDIASSDIDASTLLKGIERLSGDLENLQNLSIRFVGLEDTDVLELYKYLPPSLMRLILPFNRLTREALGKEIGCLSDSEKGLYRFIRDTDRFPSLQIIDLRGNPLSGSISEQSKLQKILAERSGLTIYVGGNASSNDVFPDDKFVTTINNLDTLTYSYLIPFLLKSKTHHLFLEEDRLIGSFAAWPEQLAVLIGFTKQPFVSLNLSGTRLTILQVTSLLGHANPTSLKKLFLNGTLSLTEASQKLAAEEESTQTGALTILLNRLKQFKNLYALDLGGNFKEASPDLLTPWIESLSAFPHLHYLGLSHNGLAEKERSHKILGEALGAQENLRALDLSHNGFADRDLMILGPVLQGLSKLAYLNLSGNTFAFDQATMETLSKAADEGISAPTPSTSAPTEDNASSALPLSVGSSSLYFFTLLPQLTVMDLRGNSIDQERFREYPAAGLPLLLHDIGHGGDKNKLAGLSQFFYAHRKELPLALLSKLPTVDLQGRKLEPQEWKTLGRMLEKHEGLKAFNLSHNKIHEETAGVLQKVLTQHTTIRDLNLSYMELGSHLEEIKDVLGGLPFLETLHLDGNNLGSAGAEILKTSLPLLRHLKSLSLAHNNFKEGCCSNDLSSLIAGLNAMHVAAGSGEPSHGLVTLDLSYNKIESSEILTSLNSALSGHARTLTTLNLVGNSISKKNQGIISFPGLKVIY